MRRGAGRRALWLCGLAAAVLAALAGTVPSLAASSRRPDYCTIPTKNYSPWGFHTGPPITGPTGSYAHGHGRFDPYAHRASGIMCQVYRLRHRRDREIILSVSHHLLYYSHVAVRWGVPGNLVKLRVGVRKSTDRSCRVGTHGVVTIFASYNGVHRDSVRFWFPAACKGHRRLYHSPSVVTNVEPG